MLEGKRIAAPLAAQRPQRWHKCSPGLSPGRSKPGTRSLHRWDPRSQACRCSSHRSHTSGARHQPSRRHRLQVGAAQVQRSLSPPQVSANPSIHPLPLLSSHRLDLCSGSCSSLPLSSLGFYSIPLPIKPLCTPVWIFLLIPSTNSAWLSPLHLSAGSGARGFPKKPSLQRSQ